MNARAASKSAAAGWAQPALIAGAALFLLLAGAALPLLTMTLRAPQYPQGLRLTIDGRGARGDIGELNTLNHYVGMPALPGGAEGEDGLGVGQNAAFPELQLFLPAIAALALGIALTSLITWPWFRGLVTLGSWALPIGFLTDLQWRLYVFGHSVIPGAPFRLPPFTPRVLGRTIVMNFDVTALPGPGLALLLASALILTIGFRLGARRRVRRPAAAAATAALILILTAAVMPTIAAAGDGRGVPPTPQGPGFDLAAAIAAAPPGATIEVPSGRYRGPLVLDRSLTLRGVAWPVIDGGGSGDVVVITGHDIRLEGFRIQGSALAYTSEAAGIMVRGDRAVIRNNIIGDVLFGIYLAGAADAVVEDNAIATADLPLERRGHAVYLWKARRARLRGNQITRGKDGLYISFSDGNAVERNTVSGCRYGIHYMYSNHNTFRDNVFRGNAVGGAVMNSTGVTLTQNTFEGSRSSEIGVGLIFKDADHLLIRDNRIVRNRIALEFDNAPASPDGWVRVERNLIAFNEVGVSLMSTAAIAATENTLVENLRPVQSRGAVRAGANRWSVGGRGNYWSDYTGFDLAGDGVGDVPYRRTDLLEDLTARAPALQAFLFTPAHRAIDVATRLVPLIGAAPIVEDRAPLMRASRITPAPAEDRAPAARHSLALLWTGALLLIPGVAGLAAARPRRHRG